MRRYSQFTVLVGSVSLEVLPDGNGLLDEVVEVLWDGWGETWQMELVDEKKVQV